ncbi:MAG TPA: hypothetical protein VGJ13_09175 [Pseudonocardiaceae bacterium]|jgi:hypothetical protein
MVGAAVRTGLPSAETARFRWERVALVGILVLAALLYGWSLGDRVLQLYYAAAVHSMSRDVTAFLFAGYDPVGVVSLDKPRTEVGLPLRSGSRP